jgi:carbon storage regulator
MLVLTRHRNESIRIGDDIFVIVREIRQNKVRIGITAPAKVPVHRVEVHERIRREGRRAAPRPGEET